MTADTTRIALETTLDDHMGQYVYQQLSSVLRDVGNHVSRPGFLVVQFPTTHGAQRTQHVDAMWVDATETGDAVPASLRNAHLKQFDKAVALYGGDQKEWCAILFCWTKECVQKSMLLHLPSLLERKDLDRRRHQEIGDAIRKYDSAKTFVTSRVLPEMIRTPWFFLDQQMNNRYIWRVCLPTTGPKLHMMSMHEQHALVDDWSDLHNLTVALNQRVRGDHSTRVYMVYDRRSIVEDPTRESEGKDKFDRLRMTEGTAVACVVTAYVESKDKATATEVDIVYAHIDPDHNEHVRATLFAQMADFASNYNVVKATLSQSKATSERYDEWLKKNGSALVQAATVAPRSASQKDPVARLASGSS